MSYIVQGSKEESTMFLHKINIKLRGDKGLNYRLII